MRVLKAILFVTASLAISSGASIAAPGTCYTGEKIHGKRVTMTGTVTHVYPQDGGGYGFRTRECPSAIILSNKKNGCRAGSKIIATGTYLSCDVMEFDVDCSADLIDSKSVTCR